MGLDWVRRHRVTDVVLLVCVIGLATVTWVTSHTDGVSAWKPCFAVSATMFLALAALTPHEPWAVAMRLALSGWLLEAPWLLVLLCHFLIHCSPLLPQATRTSGQRIDQPDSELAADRGNRVRHMPLRPHWQRRVAGNLRVTQVFRSACG